ncbi:eukaryotic translation initiation factor 3 subunit J-like, partial [Trifolium medium]|nr:eukaryotic translation initiation factor 3 subunit J-like [Trifolium medium]
MREGGLVEEADYKATKELFGGANDEKNIDTFIPKSESDFNEYAELIS